MNTLRWVNTGQKIASLCTCICMPHCLAMLAWGHGPILILTVCMYLSLGSPVGLATPLAAKRIGKHTSSIDHIDGFA